MTIDAIARVVIGASVILLTGCSLRMDPDVQKEALKAGIEQCKQQGQLSHVFANFAKVEVACVNPVTRKESTE